MKTRRSLPRIVLHPGKDKTPEILLESAEDDEEVMCDVIPPETRDPSFGISSVSPRDMTKLRMCLKEEQRLRDALLDKGIIMEEIDESVIDCILPTHITNGDFTIKDIAFDCSIYVSLFVQSEEDSEDNDTHWSDIVIKGSRYGVRYSSKEIDAIKIQYAWATHYLFKGGLFVESSRANACVTDILMRRTITILRQFCGFMTIGTWNRQCFSTIATGRVNRDHINLTRVRDHFPCYLGSDDDGELIIIQYDALRQEKTQHALTTRPLPECLRCGPLIYTIEEYELFLTKQPLILFLIQNNGYISCEGIQSLEQVSGCFNTLFPLLSVGCA